MKITEKQRIKVIETIKDFFETSCEVCKGSEWLLSDTIFELRGFQQGSLVIGGESTLFSRRNCFVQTVWAFSSL